MSFPQMPHDLAAHYLHPKQIPLSSCSAAALWLENVWHLAVGPTVDPSPLTLAEPSMHAFQSLALNSNHSLLYSMLACSLLCQLKSPTWS